MRTGWWQVFNPAIYLVSILPGAGVWLLARPAGTSLSALILGTVAVVMLQHAINLLNDVSDWRLGADVNKWDSWVRFHHENLHTTSLHGWASFLVGGLLGLGALFLTGRFWILGIALPMIALGYLYNAGSRPLSYTRLGEWVTGLCYGPGVVGCLWLLTGQSVNASAVLCMTAFAALAVALLLSHQSPQIESDRQAGKHSFAVRYGARQTCRVSRLLFGVFLLSYGLALWQSLHNTPTLAVFAAMAMLALYRTLQSPLSPKRILLPASIVIVASLVATQVTIQATTVSSCTSTCIRSAKTAFGRDARTTVITRCYRCQSITAVRRL
jgi:1,4-dihydroxy-2-naphthoate octaprenyltransferase